MLQVDNKQKINLTDEQLEYINSTQNVVLKACPGSGKSTAIAYKFLKLTKNWKCKYSGVALLSFTNVASEELNDKIKFINENSTGVLNPHYNGTIDNFLNYILLRFGYLLFKRRPLIVMDVDKTIYKVWNSQCYQTCLSRNVDFYFSIDKKLYKNNEEVVCNCINKNSLTYCNAFYNHLFNNGVILQNNVYCALYELFTKYPQIVDAIKNRYPIIIVDEAQDTSKEQMAIFDILNKKGIIFNYVGDPDQAIYEWRNADSSKFIEKYNSNKFIPLKLTINNRSSQLICDATKIFSNELSQEKNYLSNSPYKDLRMKPIILLYEKSSIQDLKEWFLSKVNSLNIQNSGTNIAIVHRKKIYSETDIKDLWKTPLTRMLAEASYEWYLGKRKIAYEKCLLILYDLIYADYKNFNINHISSKSFGKLNLSFEYLCNLFLKNLITPMATLDDWLKRSIVMINNFLTSNKLVHRKSIKAEELIKIKSRDKSHKNFKNIELYKFFQKTKKENYVYSTIHGVKGATFDALMLVVNSKTGSTLTPKVLLDSDKNTEMARLAYVAMTRPKQLLVVATYKSDKYNYNVFFDKQIWEYIEIN